MPIYEYRCDDCGCEFETLIRGSETAVCPSCGQERLTRSMSVPAAHTGSSRDPSCPAKSTCDQPKCCGNNCGMGQWM